MSAVILDGKQLAVDLREEMKKEVALLKEKGLQPGLAVILVGENPASQSYVKFKAKACQEIGIYSEVIKRTADISQEELLSIIHDLNENPNIHGILVQLPLPGHISEKAVIDAIRVEKDVDGFHPVSVGNMVIGDDCLLPCTPYGIIKLIEKAGQKIEGKTAVVVGRSNIVGKPVSMLLLQKNATVIMCHSRTADLAKMTRQADILVVAAGQAGLIGKEHVAPGAVVIDVGNSSINGKLVGDVRFDEVKETAGFITPVPGGVGPMTITMLLHNTIKAAKILTGIA